MFRSFQFSLLSLGIASVALGVFLSGCNASKPPAGEPKSSPATTPSTAQPAAPPSADADAAPKKSDAGAAAKALAGLAKLSADDRALAEKQKICPVTGELLGSMGAPVKVTVRGQTVFLCCAMCEDDLKKEPEKFLSKIGKSATRTPSP